MPERDANQLAADVRRALDEARLRTPSPPPRGTPYGDGLRDAAKTYRKADAALDELVGLVGTLRQDRDEAWRIRNLTADRNDELANQKRAAEAALATARQALTERDEAIAAALTSLATGPAKDGYAYQVLSAYAPGVT